MGQALDDAASYLGINLQRDGFGLAKRKFRNKILSLHPDPAIAQGIEADNAAAGRTISSWQIVRGYYEARGELGDGNGNREPETIIRLWVMKARDGVTMPWRVVRTWFNEMDNAPAHSGQLEMVEEVSVYL